MQTDDVSDFENSQQPATPQAARFGVPQAIFAGLALIAASIFITFGNVDRGLPTENLVQGTNAKNPQYAEITADDDPFLGRAGAAVTIIEFSDFQCPFCRRFWQETFPEIKRNYIDTGKVRFVYRDFPIPSLHAMAEPSALAALCADRQGQFWQMHDKIFAEQASRGSNTIQYTEDDLRNWAAEIGLDAADFEACLGEPDLRLEFEADVAAGRAAGVTGTPTFFINGHLLEGAQPYSSFQKAIDAAL